MSMVNELLENIPIPRVVRIHQRFDATRLESPTAVLREKIAENEGYQGISPGMSIAVAVGSRGVNHIAEFVRTIVDMLKEKGAIPFVIPAMGSHGGATAEGQKEMLASLGVTEEYLGVEIRAGMEVEQLGVTDSGLPVVMDRFAAQADGIVFVNRIKPHVAFRGPYESGLMKMITIGMGKQKGADFCHNLGFGHMAENIPAIAKVAIAKKNFVFAVGVVENAYHETCIVEVLNKGEIENREPILQQKAKELAPRLWFDKLDVCVMDELGKNISGTGFDTGVVGRYHTPYISGGPSITKIGILDLTEQSHGNANGIGIVDFTTKRLFDKFRMDQSYPNSLTSTVAVSVKIPMVLKNDKQLFQAAIKTCNIIDKTQVRLVRFKNTIELGELEVSENLISEVESCPYMELISEPYELKFNEEGNLF